MKKLLSLMAKELVHRKANAAMAVIGVAAAVAVCVGLSLLNKSSSRETRRIQRDIGFNLRIIPRNTDMARFYTSGYSEHTFPETAAHALAKHKTLSFNHIVPTLAQKFEMTDSVEVILTGIGDPLYPPGQKKPPMIPPVAIRTVHLGSEIAQALNAKQGEQIRLGDESFEIIRVAPETGSIDDLRVIGHLTDIQRVLGMDARINEISAIDCLCLTADDDPQSIIRAEIEAAVPEAKVVMLTSIADARARQRQMMERYGAFVTPITVLVGAAWVAVLAMINVRARASEIGILRAVGYRAGAVVQLFIGKAIVIGLAGALLGYVVGTVTATIAGRSLFQLTANAIRSEPTLLLWALFAAPLGAALASFIPATLAIAQDPAATLAAD